MQLLYTCVNCNKKQLNELQTIIDTMSEIPCSTFLKKAACQNLTDCIRELGYNNTFPITCDYHVRYYESNIKKKPRYILIHSAIEYVFG